MLLSRSRLAALCLSTVLIPLSAMSAPAAKHAADSPDDPAYMWDLGDLYKTPEAWTAEHDKVQAEAAKLEQYKGTLGKSAADMLTALNAYSHVRKEIARLNAYAALKGDENVKIGANQERQQSAQALETIHQRQNCLARARDFHAGCRQGSRVREAIAGTGKAVWLFPGQHAASCAAHTR